MSEPVAEKEAGPASPDNNSQHSSNPEPEKKKREYKDFGHDEEKPTRTFTSLEKLGISDVANAIFGHLQSQTQTWTCHRHVYPLLLSFVPFTYRYSTD
jgi:hypothetical protein